jgi:hypothetical protein
MILRHGAPLQVPEYDYIMNLLPRTCGANPGERAYIWHCPNPPDTVYALGFAFETIRRGGIKELSTVDDLQTRDVTYWPLQEPDVATVLVMRAMPTQAQHQY